MTPNHHHPLASRVLLQLAPAVRGGERARGGRIVTSPSASSPPLPAAGPALGRYEYAHATVRVAPADAQHPSAWADGSTLPSVLDYNTVPAKPFPPARSSLGVKSSTPNGLPVPLPLRCFRVFGLAPSKADSGPLRVLCTVQCIYSPAPR